MKHPDLEKLRREGVEIPYGATGRRKLRCPKCHDRRSDKRDKSLYVNLDHCVCVCFYCGWKLYFGADDEPRSHYRRDELRTSFRREDLHFSYRRSYSQSSSYRRDYSQSSKRSNGEPRLDYRRDYPQSSTYRREVSSSSYRRDYPRRSASSLEELCRPAKVVASNKK